MINFCLILLYALYVAIVTNAFPWLLSRITGHTLSPQIVAKRKASTEGGISMSKVVSTGSIQTAFWHRSDVATNPLQPQSKNSLQQHTPAKSNGSSSGGYSFLILDEDDPDDADTASDEVKAQPDEEKGGAGEEEQEEATINLSGGFMPDFAAIIIDDYCAAPRPETMQTPSISTQSGEFRIPVYGDGGSRYDEEEGEEEEEEEIDFAHSAHSAPVSLKESLLRTFSTDTQYQGVRQSRGSSSSGAQIPSFNRQRKSSDYQSVLTSLYWKQWSLRKRFRKSLLSTDWATLSWPQRALLLVELPVTVLRDVTIPTLDDDNWSKLYAITHPLADSLLLAFVFGYVTDSVSTIPVVLLCLLVGLGPSVAIYLLTHHNKAPAGRLFGTLWALTAFCMCIAWIYMLAGELVSCLSALGVILRLPPAFLGLTVLAWGNSVGDLFTNTAVAKQGLGEMAIAGCYGGPVFNILVGFGATLVMSCSKSYPASFSVRLDASSVLSIVFLFVALLSTMAIVTLRQFRIERWFGYYLLSVYCAYTVCQFVLLLI